MAWEKEEESFLRENGASMTVRELRKGLEPVSESLLSYAKSASNIRGKCKAMGIEPLSDGKRAWTLSDYRFLEENKNHMSNAAMAAALDRSYRSVVAKCRVEGAAKEFEMKQVTPWMPSMLKSVPTKGKTGKGKSIFDLSVEMYRAGKIVEIVERSQRVENKKVTQMALMCSVRR